jgi:hypothetical protein
MIIGRMAWTGDTPPMRAYSFTRGIMEFHDEPSRALSHLVSVVDKHRNTNFFDVSQYVIAGVWAEPAPEHEAKARQARQSDCTNTLLLLSGKTPLRDQKPVRTWCDPVVVCISYFPQKTGEYKGIEIFRKGEYDTLLRERHLDVYAGLPPEFLDVVKLEEEHRKKTPDLETFLRNPPKLDDASLRVDKICTLPPA